MREGVAVVVVRDQRFLMIQRAQGILAEGAWCFVGGGIDPGETQHDAVAREFREEIGGIVRPLRKIWEYRRPDGGLLLHWWLAELIDDRLTPNPSEVADYRWYALEELADHPNLLASNREFLRELGDEFVN